MAGGELARRLAVAGIGIPVVLVGLWFGGWVLGTMVAAVAGLTARELYGLAEKAGIRPFAPTGVAAAAGAVLIATAFPTPEGAAPRVLGLLGGLLVLSLGTAVWRRDPAADRPLEAVAVTVLGVLYVGGALAFVPLLRWLPSTVPGALTGNPWHASAYVILPVAAAWVGDSVAYFAGSAIGRRKLAPRVSPGKTVEGSVAGLIGATAAAAFVSWWALASLPFLAIPVGTAAWMGAVLGVAAQVGDLAESALKRQVGVKDSGGLLPGHGGFLDRLDALLFVFPTWWLLLVISGVLA